MVNKFFQTINNFNSLTFVPKMAHFSKKLSFLYKKFLTLFTDLIIWAKPELDRLSLLTTTLEIFENSLFLNIVIHAYVLRPLESPTMICTIVVDFILRLFIYNLVLKSQLWLPLVGHIYNSKTLEELLFKVALSVDVTGKLLFESKELPTFPRHIFLEDGLYRVIVPE